MSRYRCLVLDHDDTTVDSTRSVNYPQFQQALAHFRPDTTMTEEEYFLHCFDPGFYEMCRLVLHYTPEEMEYDQKRTEYMQSQGLQVLRISNLDVLRNFQNVCEMIDRTAKERTTE